jgi:hypothetical protein
MQPPMARHCAGVAALLFGACAAAVAADLTVKLTDDSGRPLVEAVVFLPAAGAAARPTGPRRATIVQRDYRVGVIFP